jgi:hypothetical protein
MEIRGRSHGHENNQVSGCNPTKATRTITKTTMQTSVDFMHHLQPTFNFTRLRGKKHHFGWFPETTKFVKWSKLSILADRISQKRGKPFTSMHINAANINATGVATDIAKVPQ